ncbi:MAG: manganese efflux pump MntP family protein [Nocardioidaceae bacterium]|nr:manganese efflux pump MntP family protein [Nocardioidaceae bacterium]
MTTLELVVLAVALAMDAVAVSLALGLQLRRPRWRDAFLIAGTFGLFQGLMPFAGWALAFWFADAVEAGTPWIAFGMLTLIGVKMLWESLQQPDSGATAGLGLRSVVPLAIATSIDAAAAGVTFGVLEVSVVPAVVLIGAVTMVLCFGAVFVGTRVGERLGRWASALGGLILILIGLLILLG